MDKAEIVFQKYAGARIDKVISIVRGVLSKGEKYTKNVIKGESAVLPRTHLLDKISPRYNGNNNFIGKHYAQVAPSNNIGVAKAWDTEKKLQGLEIERHKRKMGLS